MSYDAMLFFFLIILLAFFVWIISLIAVLTTFDELIDKVKKMNKLLQDNLKQ